MSIVLQHTAHLVRFVSVREHSRERWEAIFRDAGKVVFRTEIGSKYLVLECVRNVHEHRGLPIVIHPHPNLLGERKAC